MIFTVHTLIASLESNMTFQDIDLCLDDILEVFRFF